MRVRHWISGDGGARGERKPGENDGVDGPRHPSSLSQPGKEEEGERQATIHQHHSQHKHHRGISGKMTAVQRKEPTRAGETDPLLPWFPVGVVSEVWTESGDCMFFCASQVHARTQQQPKSTKSQSVSKPDQSMEKGGECKRPTAGGTTFLGAAEELRSRECRMAGRWVSVLKLG